MEIRQGTETRENSFGIFLAKKNATHFSLEALAFSCVRLRRPVKQGLSCQGSSHIPETYHK